MNKTPKILVTGANGFVGKALCREAGARGMTVNAVTRCDSDSLKLAHTFRIQSLNEHTDWVDSVKGCDSVVHLAARVHVMNDSASDPLAEFRKVNVQGTLNLARQAAKAGVRRFIFVSSVKVNGELTQNGHPFTANELPFPGDAYALSKHEAEIALMELASETGMELTIVRPPLVYGPGAKGNFLTLLRLIAGGVPLPLGAVNDNRRSWIGLDNLVDLILVCVDHPNAANQTFLVSDGEDLSTAELLRRIGKAMNRPNRLFPVPTCFLKAAATLIGKKAVAQRLLGSLQVDIGKTRMLLDWAPPLSIEEGLRRAVNQRI